jgi:hypothetical protein
MTDVCPFPARTPEAMAWWFDRTLRVLLAHRAPTMRAAMIEAAARGARTIVETGTTRSPGNWAGDGQSTLVLAECAARLDGRLYSCDLDPQASQVGRALTQHLAPRVECHTGDSVAFLASFGRPIDLLYLDSLDYSSDNPAPAQQHALRELVAALPFLHERSLVLIDDCALVGGGKGGTLIRYLLQSGLWIDVVAGYQVLLSPATTPLHAAPLIEAGLGASA